MRFWISLAWLLALIATTTAFLRLESARSSHVFAIDPPTSYFHDSPSEPFKGRVLVVHGLNSSKSIMNVFSLGLADAGFEVYSIDLPGHGDSNAGFEAERAGKAVETVFETLGGEAIVIGHSLGAALLLDLANAHDFKSMVLLSPPPTPIDHIRAERILVLTGEYDIPRIKSFVPQLEAGGAGKIDIRTEAWAGHSGAVLRPDTIDEIVTWLGGDASREKTRQRLALLAGMLVSSLGLGITLLPGKPVIRSNTDAAACIVRYVAAAFIAVLVSALTGMLRWLRFFAADHLIAVLFLTGLILLFMHRPRIRDSASGSGILKAVLAAAYVISVPGLVVGSHLLSLTLPDGRWWRFAAVAAVTLPLCVADEFLIRPIRPWWKSAAVAVGTRLAIAGLAVTAALTINRGDAFLVLIIHVVVLFWVALWFAAESVHRHTQDRFAAALFVCIVQAWVFAAVFVTV